MISHTNLIETTTRNLRATGDGVEAEEKLRRSEENLRLATGAAKMYSWELDLRTQKTAFGDNFAQVLGLSQPVKQMDKEEIFLRFLHPDDLEAVTRYLEKVTAGNSAQSIEVRLINPEKRSCIWIEATSQSVRDEAGVPVRIVGVSQNITERKRAELLLDAQKQSLEMVVSGAPLEEVLNFLTNIVEKQSNEQATASILLLNEKGCLRNGASPSLPEDYLQAIDGLAADENIGTCCAAAATGKVVITPDIETDPKWGALKHLPLALGFYAAWSKPIIARDGNVLGTFGTYFREKREPTNFERQCVEILSRTAALAIERTCAEKERESLLEREKTARREAEEAGRLKDEFLATLSHELRTPMTAVLGWTQILRSKQLDDKGGMRALEVIERNARSQNQLIEDLLDVSRIITGKLRLNARSINPSSFVEAAIEAVKPAAEAKGVRLIKIFDAETCAITGDASRLQQVVWNLLSNAIKFTPEGGCVHVKLESVGSHLEIAVEDTGAGVSQEFLPFVFDRFRQADATTTRAYGGLGLGLSIVRHLVELHGGTVEAKSEGEGCGSSFKVKLPLLSRNRRSEEVPAADDEQKPASAALQNEAITERLDGLRILVVDDEEDAGELLKILLSRLGADVCKVHSAKEALSAIESASFDVLISDIGMANMDGYEFLRRLRSFPVERGGAIPAIALTAYARTEDRLSALRAGYEMHLPKPVEPAELIAVVASVAKRKSPT